MDISVVVPTLNARDRLATVLDALDANAPSVEVVVVNGPSSDGTSGMVREHDAVDVLLELSERNLNAARNAGFSAASGDVVALVGQDSEVQPGWADAVREAVREGADVVTGPIHREVSGGVTTEAVERADLAGRSVTFFDGGNVAFTRETVEALDGFDEYLQTGAARDAAHRLAAMDREVVWHTDVVVLREERDDVADRIADSADVPAWGLKYRALSYRLVKNYGLRPRILWRGIKHAVGDAFGVACDVARGDEDPSKWFANGSAVVTNVATGVREGLRARRADDPPRRNPNGISSRMDRTVSRYERSPA
ncbi:glycosyltransferase family 2 protein [Halospeciosus flavus]|uniref:Glycosyltransferase family 2 protein n=1 Tax=Halospeciosus flavus TaxID=3032283 RepID=A0ABD5Z5I5_9EURY|nr:glycosyltransferase family 2 protein [Halospeciosus flavus]